MSANPDNYKLESKMSGGLLDQKMGRMDANPSLASSFFIPKELEVGIGEKLSPGRYKLLQGQPDLTSTKRNRSHFTTFNESAAPLSWSKTLVPKLHKQQLR